MRPSLPEQKKSGFKIHCVDSKNSLSPPLLGPGGWQSSSFLISPISLLISGWYSFVCLRNSSLMKMGGDGLLAISRSQNVADLLKENKSRFLSEPGHSTPVQKQVPSAFSWKIIVNLLTTARRMAASRKNKLLRQTWWPQILKGLKIRICVWCRRAWSVL